MRLWELARYSIENSVRARVRTTLTIVGIAIASGALVCMVAFVIGLRKQAEGPIEKLGLLNNIEVRPNEDRGQVLDDQAIEKIEALSGVDHAYPDFRLTEVRLCFGQQRLTANAIGVPREASLIGYSKEILTAGSFFSLDEEAEIGLSESAVEALGLGSPQEAIGKTVTLSVGGLVGKESKEFAYEEEQIKLRVVGVFDPPGFATGFRGHTALLPVDMMGKMPSSWMEHGLQQLRSRGGELIRGHTKVIVRAKSPGDVMRVEKKLRDLGYSTTSVIDRLKEMKQFFVFMEVLLTAVGTVALVVAGLGILNTLLMTVMERYQEIGIYKAIGASDGDIRWLFLVEAAVVGALGGVAGLGLAAAVSQILGWAFNTYAKSQGVAGPLAVFVFPWWLLCGAVAYSIVISVLSGLYPASRAARVDPIQALRRN